MQAYERRTHHAKRQRNVLSCSAVDVLPHRPGPVHSSFSAAPHPGRAFARGNACSACLLTRRSTQAQVRCYMLLFHLSLRCQCCCALHGTILPPVRTGGRIGHRSACYPAACAHWWQDSTMECSAALASSGTLCNTRNTLHYTNLLTYLPRQPTHGGPGGAGELVNRSNVGAPPRAPPERSEGGERGPQGAPGPPCVSSVIPGGGKGPYSLTTGGIGDPASACDRPVAARESAKRTREAVPAVAMRHARLIVNVASCIMQPYGTCVRPTAPDADPCAQTQRAEIAPIDTTTAHLHTST